MASKKHPGKQRPASPTNPAVIETPQGPILVYRLPLGKIGIMHPPGTRLLRTNESLTFRKS